MAKKIISLITLVLSPLVASAYDAKIDGIYYNFSESEATVTYTNYNSYLGSVIIPESVIYNNKTYSVTSIGDYAFRNCTSLTSITIPGSVTSIGSFAFTACSGLTSINIPNSVTNIGSYAFSACSGLTSINIPNSVTIIWDGAFSGCSSLTSVTIPNSVTIINESVFFGCSGLTSIIIPEGVTEIDGSAFEGCSNLTTVTLPNSLTHIGRHLGRTFKDCSALTSIVIPESVIVINGYVFAGCSALTSITIPNNIARIYSSTFSGCYSLTSISIPSNVTRIDNNAFSGCYFAKDSLINNTSLEDSSNWGAIVCDEETDEGLLIKDKNIMKCRCWATSVTIPHSIMSIESDAFIGCSELTSITIPNSVISIGGNAFQDCSGLTSITIPSSVTSIGDLAFSGCSGLTSVTIPESVTSIGFNAFSGCKLRNVLIKCTTPPTGGAAFSEQTYYHTTLYIPSKSWDAYAYDDYWYKFHNIRETATTEEQLSMQQAYTLMDASTFTYSVYDPVNECIGTINSVSGINEDNPNHSWQMIAVGGIRYLYNIGAKKYVRRSDNGLDLTDIPEPIEVEDGDNGIILGSQPAQQWALVSNEHMSVAQNAIDEVTAINSPLGETEEGAIYNLIGQRIHAPQKGLNIIGGKKVVIK